ncbi:alpha/beta hydrolase [Mycobacterium sp. djl-10]|nr:alpha/beta hydrolase [Mycobacterium sp. djl-10]
MTPTRSGHLPINGLELYFEIHGTLDAATAPLLLTPGAFMSTDSMQAWTRAFAPERTVIVFDQQGHGRTPDTPRAMSYRQFGDDAAALLRALDVKSADVLGYSQGGGVALQLAIRHAALVNKLVMMSATFHRDGWYPSVYEAMKTLVPESFSGTVVETIFKSHTPDQDAFASYITKMRTLNINDQEISDDEVRAIPAPTMVMVGDADGVTLEHAVTMFRLRGGGDEHAAATGLLEDPPAARLVILPATSHLGIAGQVDVLAPMVTAFLDDVPPTLPTLF